MAINMGTYSEPKLGGAEEENNKEVIEDKYSGEEFEIERHTDFITTLPRIINEAGVDHIMEQFNSCAIDDETTYNPDNSEVIPSDKIIEHNLSYKYQADMNKIHMTVASGSKEFNACLDVFEHLIPEHPDFETITYMQIVHYGQDSMFPFHKDIAEDTDFGTMIMQLNDEYKGGQLNVEGNIIANNEGTCTFFNNSTQMWHGVEPIYEGDRYVLLVWFGRDVNEMRGEDDDGSDDNSEMQSMSESSESTGSEVSLADE